MNAEDLYPIVAPMCAKWKVFAEKLGMDEDHIDEVFTNNETDLSCLYDLLCTILRKHTWTSVARALEEMGETELAEKCGGSSKPSESMERGRGKGELYGLYLMFMYPIYYRQLSTSWTT